MLVIASDLHLTDGTCGSALAPSAVELFAARLDELALAASYRADGSYRPIERIDVVLLGDVLDPVQSSAWLDDAAARPWDAPQRPEFIERLAAITGQILRTNEAACETLRGLSIGGRIGVPPADALGQPALGAARETVPVRLFYMVGDRDWHYRLPGASYDVLRQSLVRHLGLANRHDVPFPHDPAEDGELAETLRRHRVVARHGDAFDPLAFDGDRAESSLSEALTIEVLVRLARAADGELADLLPLATRAALDDLDQVRPLPLVAAWLEGVLERTCPRAEIRQRVARHWDRLVEQFLQLAFVRRRDGWRRDDVIDGLARALLFSRRPAGSWSAATLDWLRDLRGRGTASYYPHALGEADFRNRRARSIVYGHTHAAESVALDASYADERLLSQTYVNVGTWRRWIQATPAAPRGQEFLAADVLSFAAYYLADERRGRPYEFWSGTFGISPLEAPVVRLDPAAAAGRKTLVSPPGLHGPAPHFAAGVSHAGVVPRRRA